MAYLIGTDEAGYGPNLGPLVIAGTLWQVADDVVDEDLYQRMPDIGMPGAAAGGGRCRLLIGDSKMLYRSKAGLGRLEPGVLAAFHTSCGTEPHTMPIGWRAFIQHCDGSAVDALTSVPWYTGFDRPLPLAVSPSQIKGAHQLLLRALQGAGVTLLAIAARVVFPERFNAAVSACGSKGTALTQWTLELVEQLLQPLAAESILVQCDKHGARNRYASLLQHVFPDDWIAIQRETKLQSVYCFGPPDRQVEIRFVAKGERFMPAALASMTAKYLRELTMMAFNEFWQRHIPGLRSTAGYPTDARRFLGQIAAKQRELGISDPLLWRTR